MMLSDVCLSVAYIGPKSRTEMPLGKTKIGTEVANVTRDSDTTFKVKGQGHQAALLTTAFTHQAAAAVTVGTYSPLLLSCGRFGGARRPQMEERGGSILWWLQHSLTILVFF